MMLLQSRLFVGVLLISTLTIMGLSGFACQQKTMREQAEAALLTQSEELSGAKRALEAKPKEIIKLVPLAASTTTKVATKQGKVKPLAGIVADADSKPFTIPCPDPIVEADVPPRLLEGEVPKRETPPVTFGLHAEVLLTRVPRGPILHEASFSGVVRMKNEEEDWHADITFDPAETDMTVTVDKNIQKAMDYYDRSWFKKHTAFMCPGVGVTYNPLDTTRPVNAGVTCSYGMVWF